MEFLKSIAKSVFSPKYYKESAAKKFSYSLKYFLFFCLLVSAIGAVAFSFSFMPRMKSFLDSLDKNILQKYPDNLEITIKGGQASTNVKEPYFVKAPVNFKTNSDVNIKNLENILVIDTKTDFSLPEFEGYKTLILLTKDSLVYYQKDKGQVTINPLVDFPDYTINKQTISLLISKVLPYLNIVYPLFAVACLSGFFISLAFKMIYLFFLALLIWLIATIKKVKIGYLKSYQLGLHLLTFPIIVVESMLILSLFLPIGHIPFIYTSLVILLAIINLKPTKAVENEEQQKNPA